MNRNFVSVSVLICLSLTLASCASAPPQPTLAEMRVRQLQRELRKRADELANLKERNMVLERKVTAQRIASVLEKGQTRQQTAPIAAATAVTPKTSAQPVAASVRAKLPTKLPAYGAKSAPVAVAQVPAPAPAQMQQASNQPIDDQLAEKIKTAQGGLVTPEMAAADAQAYSPVEVGTEQTGEQRLYSKVLEVYREHRLAEMQKSVSLLLKTYPESIYADNALYLAGLLAFENGDADRASYYMERVLREYPHGNKAVSALFAKAMVEKRRGKPQQARTLLQDVRKYYPGSPEATRANLETKLIDVAATGKNGEN